MAASATAPVLAHQRTALLHCLLKDHSSAAGARSTRCTAAREPSRNCRIDDRTWEIVIKVNGERRLLVRNVVSEDGKTMRGISTVTNRGQVNQDVIYEKQ